MKMNFSQIKILYSCIKALEHLSKYNEVLVKMATNYRIPVFVFSLKSQDWDKVYIKKIKIL